MRAESAPASSSCEGLEPKASGVTSQAPPISGRVFCP